MPDGFEEMLKLCDEIRSMKKLPLPKETRSAILYSDADRMALDDKASHAAGFRKGALPYLSLRNSIGISSARRKIAALLL